MYWVVPFGNLRITSYVPIPAAYRSLSRPSSPLRAKAFPIRPYLLSRMFYLPLIVCTINLLYYVLLLQHVKELLTS
jgi:hypothetical protein